MNRTDSGLREVMKPRMVSIDLSQARCLVVEIEAQLGTHPLLTQLKTTLAGIDKLDLLGIQLHRDPGTQTLSGVIGNPFYREVLGVPMFGGLLRTHRQDGMTKRVWMEAWCDVAVAMSSVTFGEEVAVIGHFQHSQFHNSAGLLHTAEVFVITARGE